MDDFSDLSWKTAFLLQLVPGSSVVVAGTGTSKLRGGFERLGYSCHTVEDALRNATVAADVSAVVILPGSTVNLGSAIKLLASVRGDVQVMAFFKHRWNAFRGVRNGLRSLTSEHAYTVSRVRVALRSAGLKPHSTWLPLPRFSQVEEFVSISAPEEVAASMASERGLVSSIRARFHDGFGVYAVRGSHRGIESLAHALGEKMAENGAVASLEITRFDLRERGALVLFLEDRTRQKSYVCRVVRSGQAFDHLQRHWDFQRWVKDDVKLEPELSRRIPATIASLSLGDHHAWVEERAQGTVSWRIAPKFRPKLDAEILDFLLRLGSINSARRAAQVADFEREGRMWAHQVAANIPPQLSHTISRTVRRLAIGFAGTPTTFGWIHGDYGYGNVLASAASGQVHSVIDWETASRDSFIGVDLFNFLLQRARTERSSILSQAVAELLLEIRQGTFSTKEAARQQYCATFLPDRRVQLMVLGVTLCRWGLREYRYRLTRAPDVDDLIRALERFSSALDSLDEPAVTLRTSEMR